MPEVKSGFISLLGGCHSGISSRLLGEAQFSRGLNVSVRDGLVRTRPVFKKIATLASGITKFQGAHTYRLNDADRVVTAIDGSIRIYNLATGANTSVASMSSSVDFMYFGQADRYLVVQDGVNRPKFLHEGSLFDTAKDYRLFNASNPDHTFNEVFTGTHTAYGHGRIFTVAAKVHLPNGMPSPTSEGRPYFVAGDIIKPSYPREVFKFTETLYLNEGGAAGMPGEYGFIQGMAFFKNISSGTGLGPLIVFARDGVAAFAVNTERDPVDPTVPGWSEGDFSQILFSGIGTLSPRSILNVNDDLLFRSEDGIRSIRYTSSESAAGSGALSATPISNEVSYWLGLDAFDDLPYVSSAFVNNRVFFTSAARSSGAFRGLTCMDSAAVYGITTGAPTPMYNGIWTGLPILQVLSGRYSDKRRLLVVALNGTNVELWYLDDDAVYDSTASEPLCRVYTRSDDFGSGDQFKRFSHIDLWIRDLRGDATITAYYRADGYELWNTCNTVSVKSDVTTAGAQSQRRYRVRLAPEAEELYDPVTTANLLAGTSFQFCLEWTGNLAIEQAVYAAMTDVEEPPELCCDGEDTAIALVEGPGGLLLDDFTYSML